MRCKMFITIVGILLFSGGLARASTWTRKTIDYPGASYTSITGVSGNIIVGYSDLGNFVYNLSTNSWTTLSISDTITGIDGSNIIGYYGDIYNRHGFLHDGTTLHTFDNPNAASTIIEGIDGSNLVGYYDTGRGTPKHGFLYDGTNWITLDMPDSQTGTTYQTVMSDVDGSNIVGNAGGYAVLYNISNQSWTILNVFGDAAGISENNIVGSYVSNYHRHGFLYNLSTNSWITLDMPESFGHGTRINGIDGDKVVGDYFDIHGNLHGFLYTIPEPTTFLLFTISGLLLRRIHK